MANTKRKDTGWRKPHQVRWSDEEWQKIVKAAKAEGWSASEFIRRATKSKMTP